MKKQSNSGCLWWSLGWLRKRDPPKIFFQQGLAFFKTTKAYNHSNFQTVKVSKHFIKHELSQGTNMHISCHSRSWNSHLSQFQSIKILLWFMFEIVNQKLIHWTRIELYFPFPEEIFQFSNFDQDHMLLAPYITFLYFDSHNIWIILGY